jgi:hypothetical protein
LAIRCKVGFTRTLRGGLRFLTVLVGFRSLALQSLGSATRGTDVNQSSDHHEGDYQNDDDPTVHDFSFPGVDRSRAAGAVERSSSRPPLCSVFRAATFIVYPDGVTVSSPKPVA